MASTLTRRNAEISLKALVARRRRLHPEAATNREVTTSATFRRELIEKIRQLGARSEARRGDARARRRPPRRRVARQASACVEPRSRPGAPGTARDFTLRPFALDAAARAADRLLDRRAAGADRAGRAARGR